MLEPALCRKKTVESNEVKSCRVNLRVLYERNEAGLLIMRETSSVLHLSTITFHKLPFLLSRSNDTLKQAVSLRLFDHHM